MNRGIVPVPLGVRTLLVAFHRVLPLPTTLAWEVTRRLRAVTQTEQDNILTIFVANYRERNADDGRRDGDDDRYQQLDVAVEHLRTVAPVQEVRWWRICGKCCALNKVLLSDAAARGKGSTKEHENNCSNVIASRLSKEISMFRFARSSLY